MRIVSSLVLAAAAASLAAPTAAHADPSTLLATCDKSQLELAPAKAGETAVVHAKLATPKGPWQFTAKVGLARIGKRTRTLALEEPKPEKGGSAGFAVAPSQVFVDLFVDDKKLAVRHMSEGGADPEIVFDLAGCKAGPDLDKALAKLVEPSGEEAGCAPATVRDRYAKQLAPLKLPAADAEREARALCEAHQKALASRLLLEQRLSDAAARARAAGRGAAIGRAEEARIKAWEGVDACLEKAAPADPPTAAKLRAAEDKIRACYDAAAPEKK